MNISRFHVDILWHLWNILHLRNYDIFCCRSIHNKRNVRKLKYFEVMVNIFEMSHVLEIAESWLVYTHKFPWIFRSYSFDWDNKTKLVSASFLIFRVFTKKRFKKKKLAYKVAIIVKGALIQIWKSANIFVFAWKYVEDFTLKHYLRFEICARKIGEKFVYKHSELTIKCVKN